MTLENLKFSLLEHFSRSSLTQLKIGIDMKCATLTAMTVWT